MRQILSMWALAALAVMCFAITVFGQIPSVISYQGILVDPSGKPITDSVYSMKLTLYDSTQGGHALWTETQPVNVHGGIFNVKMGIVIPIALPFNVPYWLGVALGSNAEFTPRTLLTTAPYARNSSHADTAAVALTLTGGAGGGGVTSLNGNSGAITIVGSGATTVTTYGDSIVIASSGSGGPTGVQTIQNTDGTISVTNKNGPITTIGVAAKGINTAQLANNAVTTAQLANN